MVAAVLALWLLAVWKHPPAFDVEEWSHLNSSVYLVCQVTKKADRLALSCIVLES